VGGVASNSYGGPVPNVAAHSKLQTTDNRITLVTEDPNKSAAELRAQLAEMLADIGLSEDIVNAIASPGG
jgi:predicted nucleic acid-binding Zn ribbon protein